MVKLTFHGHSAAAIESNGTRIVIDPYFTDNPQATAQASEIEADYVIVTHAHADHVGDAFEIAKRCNATFISNFEISLYAESQGCQISPMHLGGGVDFPFGRVKLTLAFHGSTYEIDGKPVALGNPAGVVVSIEGKNIYHAGDTALFSDMKLIAEDTPLDLALLPIGDRFTMGPKDAIKAAGFLQPKRVIPMHYNTWPLIEVNPEDFVSGCKEIGIEATILKPGESIDV